MKKRTISFLMSIFIALSLTPFGAFAEDGEPIANYYTALKTYNEAVENEENVKEALENAQTQLEQFENQKIQLEEQLEEANIEYVDAQKTTNYLFENIVLITEKEVANAEFELEQANEAKIEAENALAEAQAYYDEVFANSGEEEIMNEIAQLQAQLLEKQNYLEELEYEIEDNQAIVNNAGKTFLNDNSEISLNDFIEDATNQGHGQYINDQKFNKVLNASLTVANINKALDFIDECNEYRANHGVGALKVDPELMLGGMVSNAISSITYDHTYDIGAGENLAWGYVNPFDGWYHQEKEYFDQHGSNFAITGHYENIVYPHYKVTGFAWAQQGRTMLIAAQEFGYYANSSYTVAEFRNMFNDAVAGYNNALQESIANKEETIQEIANIETQIAEKQALLEDDTELENALNALNNAQAALETAEENVQNKTNALEAANERLNVVNDIDRNNPESYGLFDNLVNAVSDEKDALRKVNNLTAMLEETKEEITKLKNQISELQNAYNEAVLATQAAKEFLETFKVPAEVVKVSKVYNKTYNGKYQRQTPLITYDGKTLVKDTDYKLYYSKNKYVGTATMTIRFRGDYEGTIKKTFTIRPKGTYIRNLARGTRSFTTRWAVVSKAYRTSISGYQVRYSRKSSFKTYNTYRTTRKTKSYAKISKLRKNTRYYVKVRTFKKVGSKYYYSKWSKTKSVRTK